jgi:flagellar hook assembly protein FlgD
MCIRDRSYTIKVDATDASGRKATQKTKTVVMDCAKPVIDYVSMSKSLFSPTGSNSVTIRYTLNETARVSIVARNASDTVAGTISSEATKTALSTAAAKSYSVNWKALSGSEGTSTVADGTYTVQFSATDTAGNVDTDTATIVIDKTSPTVTVSSLTGFAAGSGSVSIPVTLSENAVVTVTILDSNSRSVKTICSNVPLASAGATFYWDGKKSGTTYQAAGTYTVKVVAKDSASNSATNTTRTFTIS